jgi:hypothetical protein
MNITASSTKTSKLAYTQPSLIEYGSVATLTQDPPISGAIVVASVTVVVLNGLI